MKKKPQQTGSELSPHSKWQERILLAGLLVWTFLLGCTPMTNYDIWWHLRTGQWIVENGGVPFTDLYTYKDAQQPWTNLHWGFQLLALGLHSLGGVNLLVLAKAACLTLAVAIGWRASGNALPAWAGTLCWILPVVILSGRAVVRPEMLSLIFLAIWLWIAGRVERRPRLIWWLPALQVVWVNCHGLFVLGLVVGAAFVLDRIVREFLGGRLGLEPASRTPETVFIFRAGVLALIACLVNPYFDEGVLFPLELYRKFTADQELYAQVGEFQQPIAFFREHGFQNLYLNAVIALWIAAAAGFVLLLFQRRVNVMRLLLFVAFSHLAWKASRNSNVFALVAGVVFCGNLNDLLQLRRTAKTRNSTGKADIQSRGSRWMPVLTGAVLAGLIASIFTGHWAAWGREQKTFGLGERAAWYPHDAVRFAGQPGLPPIAFVAHFGVASVYEYHNGPHHKVFMDGRLEVVSRETYELYHEILRLMSIGDPGWQRLVGDEAGNLPVIILDVRSQNEIRGMLALPNWRPVFADPAAIVFVEEHHANRLKLRRLQIVFPGGG